MKHIDVLRKTVQYAMNEPHDSYMSPQAQAVVMSHAGHAKLPWIVWVVIFFTLLASVGSGQLLGFKISGLSWVIPLVVASFILVQRLPSVSFPVKIWIPWILLLIVYLVVSDDAYLDPRVSPLQRTVQLISPIIVGAAVSTYRPSPGLLAKCVQIFRYCVYFLVGGSVIVGLTQILALQPTGLAAQVMTGLLLAVFFVNRYLIFKEIKDLKLYLIIIALPVLAITRTAIAVALMVAPLSFAPMGVWRRLIIAGVVSATAIWIFYLPQVQNKMFYTGHGEISDIGKSEDFATTGRFRMWEILFEKAKQEPWFGHGTGQGETLTYAISQVGYPHNDWVLTYFDYGVLGVGLFLICNLLMILHGWAASKRSKDNHIRLFFLTGISAFIPFMMMMITDNIMVYASFFGNLHFMIIGLAYGALRSERVNALPECSKIATLEKNRITE